MGVRGGWRLRIWHYRNVSKFNQNRWKDAIVQEIKRLMLSESHWEMSEEF